ncbi:pyridoxal 5'-phosphate synthase glutaminase subunit PdxT [Thermodesulfobacteriota bacterium]
MKIGVLALQGDFIEHIVVLRRLGIEAVEVRLPQELKKLSGLIIPGGESTTIGKLAANYGLLSPLRNFAATGAIWGTCAGMILMAKEVGVAQPLLGLMDIKVQRNAFGRQKESFKADLKVRVLNEGESKPFPGVFIRAPKIIGVSGKARVIADLADGTAVAAQEGRWLVTAFHPELTNDDRFHQYFVSLI